MFHTLYSHGTPSTADGNLNAIEPNLIVPDYLYLDGNLLDYDLPKWDFQPSKDVYVENTGYGLVRVIWPELEATGILSFTLNFVPQADLEQVIRSFYTGFKHHWLSYRGRKYKIDNFNLSYSPIPENPDYYRVDVRATAYRPHKTLPPVPGTSIQPIIDIRRLIANTYKDRIIWVDGFKDWLVIFTTAGITFWNLKTGNRFDYATPINDAGLVSTDNDKIYVVWHYDNKSYFKAFGFDWVQYQTIEIDIPFFEFQTHKLIGDTLLIFDGLSNYLKYSISELKVNTSMPTGLKINPCGNPSYFTSSPTANYPDTLANVPTDAFYVYFTSTNKDEVLVFRHGGVYLHKVVDNVLSTQIKQLDSYGFLHRAGIFGSPLNIEGYWVKEIDNEILEEYIPSSDPLVPLGGSFISSLTDSNSDGWLEVPIAKRKAFLRSIYSETKVIWGNLLGIYFDGTRYYPFTDQHIFVVTNLL